MLAQVLLSLVSSQVLLRWKSELNKASIMEVITRDARCPMDRRALGAGDLIEPPPPTELTQAPIRVEDDMDEATDIRIGSSSKIDQLMHLLRLTPPNEKSLVFSQFTTFLDKVSSSAWIVHTNNLPE